MIRPLRARHRTLMFALSFTLPLLFAAGLLARGGGAGALEPVAGSAPELTPSAGLGSACIEAEWRDDERWSGLAITTRVGRAAANPEQRVCELEAREPLAEPDLLLYWSVEASLDQLSADAYLLGAWDASRRCFALPAGFATAPGHLTLFSLGHGRVVGTASLER